MTVMAIHHSTPIVVFSIAKDSKTKSPSLDFSKAVPVSFANKKPKETNVKKKKAVKKLRKQAKKKKQKKKSSPRMELIR